MHADAAENTAETTVDFENCVIEERGEAETKVGVVDMAVALDWPLDHAEMAQQKAKHAADAAKATAAVDVADPGDIGGIGGIGCRHEESTDTWWHWWCSCWYRCRS